MKRANINWKVMVAMDMKQLLFLFSQPATSMVYAEISDTATTSIGNCSIIPSTLVLYSILPSYPIIADYLAYFPTSYL